METPDVAEALTRIRDLPTLPAVLGKILSTAADPASSAIDLGHHIAADVSLSATLLKLVNSSYYGFYRQINSVTQAIIVLGFLEVRNLTLTATAFNAFEAFPSNYDREQLWCHSLATAIAADRIARLTGRDTDGCFEAALLHDMGKVALDWLYPQLFRKAATEAEERKSHIADAEQEIFGMTHATVGGLLAEHWNLPESVVEAVQCHHSLGDAKVDVGLVRIVAAANCLTYKADFGESSNGQAPELSAELKAELGLTEANCDAVVAELVESRTKIEGLIGALSGAAA
ncbi:MAG: HDOD domain-containing protein [Candidatus Hydrogenedentes bacterium]|nr:HDOD domain-containing protein [Candidatus Hydrogenedentota bacterium]